MESSPPIEGSDLVRDSDLAGLEPLAPPTALAPMPVWPPPDVRASVAVVGPLRADRHPALVYLAGLAPGSRRTMRQALDSIAVLVSGGQADATSLPWYCLTYAHTAAIRAVLAERYAPATANKMLAALRGTLKEAWRLGLLDAETYRRAADVGAVRGSTISKGRSLSPGEIRPLFTACANDVKSAGVRDAALIAVLYGGGLRRAEVVQLDVRHYDLERHDLLVRGKGRKERRAHLQPAVCAAVSAWLELRAQALPGVSAGALFLPITKIGSCTAPETHGTGDLEYSREAPHDGGDCAVLAARRATHLHRRPPRRGRRHLECAAARRPRQRADHRPLRSSRRTRAARGSRTAPCAVCNTLDTLDDADASALPKGDVKPTDRRFR